MTRTHAVFLRAVSNVPMAPFRQALEEMGLIDVASYGTTGNFAFAVSPGQDPSSLQSRIAHTLGTDAFVRDKHALAAIVEADPFAAREGAVVYLLDGPPSPARLEALGALRFAGERPVVIGTTLYAVHPTTLVDHRAIFDFERALGVRATGRSSRVLGRVLALMA